jgi:mercuric ion transport protein
MTMPRKERMSVIRRQQRLMAAGGMFGALAASSCCLLPPALFGLGVSGAWITMNAGYPSAPKS